MTGETYHVSILFSNVHVSSIN